MFLGAGEMFMILLVSLPVIFFLLTLQKALNRCSIESRTMTPGSVWLLLIPVFNLIWQYIVVARISRSLHNEFTKRNISENPKPGKSLGIAYCTLGLFSILLLFGVGEGKLFASALFALLFIAASVCWISYWVLISGYSSKLARQ
jgi:hypothetical protein